MTITDAGGGADDGDTVVYDSSSREVSWSGITLNGTFRPEAGGVDSPKELTFQTLLDPVFPYSNTFLTNYATVETDIIPSIETSDTIEVVASPDNIFKKFVINETAVEDGRANSGENAPLEYGQDANEFYEDANDVHAVAGDVIRYSLVYKNNGNSPSPNMILKDHVPKYILDENGELHQIVREEDFIDLDTSVTLEETETGFDVIWDLGDIDVTDDYLVQEFRVRLNPDSVINISQNYLDNLVDNVSELTSENDEIEDLTDNAIILVEQPLVTIEKGADKVEYMTDEEVVYSIEVSNEGTAPAKGIVRDTLPEGLGYINSDWPTDKINVDGQNIEFTVDYLEVGENIEITITANFTGEKPTGVFNNEVKFIYTDLNDNPRPEVSDEVEITIIALPFLPRTGGELAIISLIGLSIIGGVGLVVVNRNRFKIK